MRPLTALVPVLLTCLAPAQGPKIVEISPANGATDINPNTTKQLKVVFDRDMRKDSHSFCGGGPSFPKVSRVEWVDSKTVICHVQLEADRQYVIGLNCPAAQNFKSANGTPLTPVPWRFATAAARPLSPAEQRALNRQATENLWVILPKRYSYFDTHGLDLAKLQKEHGETLLGAKSHRAWAEAAAKMLAVTKDLHLYLRYQGQTFPCGSRRVDPLLRPQLLPKYLDTDLSVMRKQRHLPGRAKADKDVGYLLLADFSRLDADAVLEEIADQAGTKALILDMRGNSGGNELLARKVAAPFIKGNKVYAKNRFRIARGKDGFGNLRERRVQGADEKQRYKGKVFVLMSRYCMSSCEAFLLMMKQAENCTLVGQRSYGSSGNPKAYSLPNGVQIMVPSWQALRPDGTCFETEGIAPDVEVSASAAELQSRDPILEKALELASGVK